MRFTHAQDASHTVRLGDVEVRPDRNEIRIDGQIVRLKPKAVSVLLCLIEARGEVVTKDRILDQVWPNMTVSHNVLTAAVHELRRALGDDSRKPRFIQTIPRRGYRVVAEVDQSASAPRIAVLPFSQLSDDPEDRYFCDGLAEDLINGLGRARHSEVVSRVSSFKVAEVAPSLRKVAEKLNATHLVTGSFRRNGERIRVVAHLIQAKSDTELWSQVFDRHLGDLLAVQDEIARAIARAVVPRLDLAAKTPLVAVSTTNLEAYREFSKGRHFWKQDNSKPLKAMEHYQKALALDPEFALAHAGMVECYNTLAVFHLMPQVPAREASIQHAEQVLFQDPDAADSQFAFGYTQFYMHWNWRLAEMALKRALSINSNHVLAHCFLAVLCTPLRRWDESRRYAATATRLDPFSPFTWWIRAICSHYRRDFEDQFYSAEQGLEFYPDDVLLNWISADALARLGRTAEALARVRMVEGMTDQLLQFKTCAGAIYALLGRLEDAERICKSVCCNGDMLENAFVCSYLLATLGRVDAAFEALEQAERERDSGMWLVACSPYFDGLRADPRFTALLERLQLDEATLRTWVPSDTDLRLRSAQFP